MEDALRRKLASAHAEALRVGDSPLRADRVAAQIQAIMPEVGPPALDEDRAARITAFLENALRVLRRDDDGREAARHIDSALSLFGPAPKRASPFLDP